jgi:nusB family protein
MLTRSLLRTKIAQILYANARNSSIQAFDEELKLSLKKAYDLYHFLLLLPQEMAFMAQKEVDTYSTRLLKTDRNIKPIYNLATQKFPLCLSQNEALSKYTRDNLISWANFDTELGNIYKKTKSAIFFDKYIGEDSLDFDVEKTFWRKFFRSGEVFDEGFEAFLEEVSIYWVDDIVVTLSFIDKTISKFTEDNISTSPLLPMYRDENEREFVVKLSHTAFLKGAEYEQMISKIVPKWDVERITKMDMVLMKMAIAEFKEFPLIPIDITINEYIEISKFYSTSKSYIFINGILDTIAKEMLASGSMIKVE